MDALKLSFLVTRRVYSPVRRLTHGPTAMHPIAKQLLDQHVEFELEALTDKRVQTFLRDAVKRGFEFAEDQTLGALITENRCVSATRRLLADSRVPPTVTDFGVSLFLRFREQLAESQVELRDLIDPDGYIELVELVVGLHEPRRRLLAEIFRHPLYGELISSLVYEALLNYLIQDNLITQKVPGVGSMLKLGRKVATRAVPGLDATVERQLKSFIKGYLPSLIKTSEQIVDAAMTSDGLVDQFSDAWPAIGKLKLTTLTEDLQSEDVERFGTWLKTTWDELRQTDWFMETAESLIGHFFDRYGDQPVAQLLNDVGIKRGMVNKEVLAFGPPLLKQLRASGVLTELLRLRLQPFYESAAVSDLLQKR
ncbi:MAG: hypothetical protein AAGI67_18685 [Pseudomonadota bacterium]